MRNIKTTQRTKTATTSRIAVQGTGTGDAKVAQELAVFTRQKRDEGQAQAFENAYLNSQTVLENDLTEIENQYQNDPQALGKAMEDYREKFIGEITDPNMSARLNLQIEKNINSSVARATSKHQGIINDTARFENLKAFDSIQNELGRVAAGMASPDPAVAEASKQQFQEMTQRAGFVMGATDSTGAPLFPASTRFNQLTNMSDTALEAVAKEWFAQQPDKVEALKTWESGGLELEMPSAAEGGLQALPSHANAEELNLITGQASANGLSEGLAVGVYGAETDFGRLADATSSAGAIGPMQTMPKTLKDPGYGVTPAKNNSREELRRVGVDYLAAMMEEYGGNEVYALAAYNWGPGNVNKWIEKGAKMSALPKETQGYIKKALKYKRDYEGGTDVVNVRESVSPQVARMFESEAKRQITQQDAAIKQQRNLLASQIDLVIETATDDPLADPNAVGPQQPRMTRAQKLSRALQEIDSNELLNSTPEGVIKANGLREKVFKKLEDERKKIENVAAGSAFAGGQSVLNRQDPEAVKQFNDYYESLDPAMQQLQPNERNVANVQIIDQAKAVPKKIKGDIQRVARSRNVEDIAVAADFIDRLTETNPHMISDLADAKDLARIDMVNDRIDIGYSPEEALKIVDEQLDPRNELTLADATQELKDAKIDYKSKAMNLFDSSIIPMRLGLETEGQHTINQLTGMTAAYRVAYEDQYKITRDKNAAQKYAERITKGRFGVSQINGGNQVMQDAPEKHYAIPGVDNGWMREQMIEDAKGFFKDAFRADNKKYSTKDLEENLILVSDNTTRRTVETGRPTYLLMYKQDDGTFQKVGGRYYFDPAKQKEKLLDEAQSIVKAKQKEKQAIEEFGRFGVEARLYSERATSLERGQKERTLKIDARLADKGLSIE